MVRKPGKHQRWKQWCCRLWWKLPDRAQSFSFCLQMWLNKLKQYFYWSVSSKWQEAYWTLCTVRSKKAYKNPNHFTLNNYGTTKKAVVSTQGAWCNEPLKVTTIKSSQKVYKRLCNRKPISTMSVYSLWVVKWLDRNTLFRTTSLLNSIPINAI